jgi:hypothetical protein
MIFMKLYRYLTRTRKVKPLPHELTTRYDPLGVSWDDYLIMMTARAKDPHAVNRLKSKYGADTAAQLIPLLPPRRRPTLRQRLRTWGQRLEGSYAADPYRMELRRARRKRFINTGYSETTIPLVVTIRGDNE